MASSVSTKKVLLGPCTDGVLDAYLVSTLLNNARNEGPKLTAPVG